VLLGRLFTKHYYEKKVNPTLAGAIGKSQASGNTMFITPCLSGLQKQVNSLLG